MLRDLAVALSEIAAVKTATIEQILSGRCQDYTAYKSACSYIQGLDKAYELITTQGDQDDESE